MPTTVASTSIGAGIRYTVAVAGDGVFVPVGNTVMSTDNSAIDATVNNATVTVAGSVFGDVRGIDLGGDPLLATGGLVRVLTGGIVAATQTTNGAGVRVQATNSEIYNEGSITGGYGILIGGSAGGVNTVTNLGTISGDVYAVRQFSGSTDELVLWNYGDIIGLNGSAQSFSGDFAGGATSTIHNRGLMRGDIAVGDATDTVDNRGGTIDGTVYLGAGTDSYDGRGGQVLGTVFGDDGDDSFIGNAAAVDVFDGGLGLDSLDFRFGPAVTVALDGTLENDGGALGDTYLNFERVTGSTGADVIRGNSSANQLLGQAGADAIDGAAGADLIRGGLGVDTLTGGLGNDSFRFQTLAEVGDIITDFSNVGGNDDKFQIVASAFGGGLVAGALAATQFQSRADNVAQDANDRFIFRTTDRTLWFDADGNGAGAAVLVADLQAGAVVTAADIQLI